MADASPSNGTSGFQYQGALVRALGTSLTTAPCCVFLLINATMMFTLRSRALFRETSRYVLLFNLLFADTLQMALAQLLYLMAVGQLRLTYPVCGVLSMLANLTNNISPLTLVLMSLERYVAVCWPLRHASIATVRNTLGWVAVVWSISCLNVLTRVLLMLEFPFATLPSLTMKDFCSDLSMMLGSTSAIYDRFYTCFLFVLATLAIVSSYAGVMMAARLASTDAGLAGRARNTLLLHLAQLGLSLISTVYNLILMAVARRMARLVFVRVQIVFYVCIIMFPRFLSSLIYGLRDQSIRPVLVKHLCCSR